VDKLNPVRDLSRPPILSVMFQVIRHNEGEQMEGLQLKNLPMEMETSQIDLYFGFIETPDGLEMMIDYSTDLFKHETLESWLGYFERLMQGILEDPQQPLAQLALVEEAEREALLAIGSGSVVEYPVSCIHERFEAQAERTPDAEAVVFANGNLAESLTYTELNRRANLMAHHLHEQGIRPEKTVVIRMVRSLEMVVAVLGVLKAGGAYVPIDPEYPTERVKLILEDTQAEVVLTQQHLMYSVPRTGAKVICVDADWARIAESSGENLSSGVIPQNLAYVMYTSGSTGQPKGVLVEHRSVRNLLDAQRETCDIAVGSRVLQFASLSFDPSVFEMFAALTTGATLVVASKDTLQPGPKMTTFMREQGITFATLTPAVLALLAPEELPALRVVGCGGEACPLELAEKWAVGRTFLNIYGPTEATVMATWNPSEEGSVSAHIGRPLANVQAYLLDANLQPVPVEVPGELYLGGAGLARGYLNQAELTAERFVAHPFATETGARLYKTGDRARFLEDGNIEFLGRSDEQVKIRGIRIELGEVEQVLKQHPSVRDAVVLVREDVPGDKRLVAYVVGLCCPKNSSESSDRNKKTRTHCDTAQLGDQLEGVTKIPQMMGDNTFASDLQKSTTERLESLKTGNLRAYLLQKLPEFMVPAHFVTVEELPLTSNGKVDRRALPTPSDLQAGRETQHVVPRDVLELQLVNLWEELLEIRPIGVRDNFFSLGGHSLLGVRLLTRIQQRFGVELSLSSLFHGGTIEGLAQHVRHEEQIIWNALVPIQARLPSRAEKLPFFVVHPIGGSVLCYRELAGAFGADQPVYGLQARGLVGEDASFASVEEMAAHYVEAIRSVQESGPYHLGGWSFGGVVAFEMARLLTAQGHEVATLALLDSFAPDEAFRVELPDEVELLKQFVTELADNLGVSLAEHAAWLREVEPLKVEAALAKLYEQAAQESLLPHDLGLEQLQRLFQVFRAHMTAYRTYTPVTYSGDLTLFAAGGASERDANGWRDWVAGEVAVHVLNCDHVSLLKPPHAEMLAERLMETMERTLAPVVRV
jgi:amino acid adenylation domain-containing protein